MRVLYATRPYEKVPGSANALHEKWKKICNKSLATRNPGIMEFTKNIRGIIRDFDKLERLDIKKPRVGIVGEILVKFSPMANNHIVDLLEAFRAQPQTLLMPEIAEGSFAKKLYSTYLSYLPKEKASFALKMNVDARGSFTELLKTVSGGQFSVNVSKPGITKGEHWHHSKWEIFLVVSGKALIKMRKIGCKDTAEYTVSGDKLQAVYMLPGYTHSITNLSDTEKLITLMWANEPFDPNKPDTFFEVVKND